MFNVVGAFKSWLTFRKRWSHLRPLVQSLRTRPYDLAALAALNDELTWHHQEMPESVLWQILDWAKTAGAPPSDATVAGLLADIERGALWEVQTRYRAT